MIPVYICDDNKEEKKHLKEMVENLLMIQDYDMRVVLAAETPEAILAHRQTHTNRSVYILDVELKHKTQNGFTLAKQLRELDARGFIVFVTTHEEMMYETFKYRIEAMDYLIKEDVERFAVRLGECLAEINHLVTVGQKDDQNYFTIKADGCVFHIPHRDILYFKTAGEVHRVTLHAINRRLEFRGDLNTLEAQVGSAFLRTHRSFLVRADKIRQIHHSGKMLIIEDGSECLVSRKGKLLLKTYFENKGL